ncbi:PREDICTED: uncharacterized protein LOC109340258 [Lupinus angustifolius]|uniref:uncharacterized protein LOC109340258 n=1 Tax=Lupinus angustifolius TaxID=3871 RepID=UPI00092E85CC|nr:PREDICTED: uncharacterized protein LOC109340258 [Lupinus angustifolius]
MEWNDLREIQIVKNLLNEKFNIKDIGNLKYFIGMEVPRSKEGISLCQRKYTLDLLEDTGLLAAKPATTPMDSAIKLHENSGPIHPNPTAYKRLLGMLIYLSHTRPAISYVVSHLSQFLSKPIIEYYNARLRILRYLKTAHGKGLFFSSKTNISLKGFSDSDWGACIDTRRSVTCYYFYIGESLILWKSKRQRTVSRSSKEAEYRVLALVGCEAQ